MKRFTNLKPKTVPTNLGYHRPYSSLTTTELDKPTNLKCLKATLRIWDRGEVVGRRGSKREQGMEGGEAVVGMSYMRQFTKKKEHLLKV